MSDSKWVDRLAALESRVARQHRLVWMVLALEAPRAAGEVLTVRGLVVVDDEGVERVRIGTPLPDPIVNGRRVPRQGVVSGVLIFDAEGDERGGYVTEAHGDAMLTLVSVNGTN